MLSAFSVLGIWSSCRTVTAFGISVVECKGGFLNEAYSGQRCSGCPVIVRPSAVLTDLFACFMLSLSHVSALHRVYLNSVALRKIENKKSPLQREERAEGEEPDGEGMERDCMINYTASPLICIKTRVTSLKYCQQASISPSHRRGKTRQLMVAMRVQKGEPIRDKTGTGPRSPGDKSPAQGAEP